MTPATLSENHRLTRLRALVHESPSVQVWERIIRLLLEVDGSAQKVMVDYLWDHVSRSREAWAQVATSLPGRWFGRSSAEVPALRVWEALGCPSVKMRLIDCGRSVQESLVEVRGGDDAEDPAVESQRLESPGGDCWVMSTPVTQALYVSVMGENPSTFRGAKRPVERVSWYDAVVFCNGLSQLEGYDVAYAIQGEVVNWLEASGGYRLLTEAEWVMACRAGVREGREGREGRVEVSDSDERVRNEVDWSGWYRENSGDETKDVGLKVPNAFGLYDMLGHVWEWCWDGAVGGGASAGVFGGAEGDASKHAVAERVIRGGSFSNRAGRAHHSGRRLLSPGFRFNDIGFRVSRSDVTPPARMIHEGA